MKTFLAALCLTVVVTVSLTGCHSDDAGIFGGPGPGPQPDAGVGWNGLGGAGTGEIAPTRASSGKIAVSNGVPYAAFSDESVSGRLSVMKYSGSAWANVGIAGFTPGYVSDFVLYVDQGTPYVAFTGSSSYLSVMKFDSVSLSWVTVGSTSVTVSYYSSSYDFMVSGGVLYLAFSDSNSQLHVQSLSNGVWVDLGGTYVSSDGQYPALAMFNGNVTVVFSDSSGSNYNVLTLMSFTGYAWVSLATSTLTIGSSYGTATSLTVSSGILYIIFYSSTYGPVVLRLNGGVLTSVGTLGTISNNDYVEYVSGVVYNGVPYVAFDDEARDSDPEPRAATVKYYDTVSGIWQLYAGYPDSCDIENTYLAVDQNTGSLYFTYNDCNGAMTVKVK